MKRLPRTCYLICSAPRSGSHLLSTLLTDTLLAGHPQEHFNPWHMGDADDEFPDELVYDAGYVQGLFEKYTAPNGVFGTKAQFSQITNFVGLGRLEGLFPTELHYLYVRRLDVVRQAVSLAKAEQTGQWVWDEPVNREPAYNLHQLTCCLRETRIQAKGWEVYFMERGITPFRVIYEELVAEPEQTVLRALRFLGVKIPEAFEVPPTRLRKQADDSSEEWVSRFRSDIAREA